MGSDGKWCICFIAWLCREHSNNDGRGWGSGSGVGRCTVKANDKTLATVLFQSQALHAHVTVQINTATSSPYDSPVLTHWSSHCPVFVPSLPSSFKIPLLLANYSTLIHYLLFLIPFFSVIFFFGLFCCFSSLLSLIPFLSKQLF